MDDNIDEICRKYGATFLFDQFSCTIKFKDGKELVYAMCNQARSIDGVLQNAENTILSDAHGRIFKDNMFVGYAPKASSIDELLVAVDMMM